MRWGYYDYKGVKFKSRQVGKEIPQDTRILYLSRWGKTFHRQNLAPPYEGGSYGNLSFRVEESGNIFIITASQSSLNDPHPENFVRVENVSLRKGGVLYSGAKKPSSETPLHYAIYNIKPDVHVIMHGHSVEISSNADRLGIPITKVEREYGTIELVNEVLGILDDNHIIEMRNHGFVAIGREINETGELVLRILGRAKSP